MGLSREEALAVGRNPERLQEEMWPDCILEIEPIRPVGGKVVWEWHLWDHLIQDRDPELKNHGVVDEHPELVDVNGDEDRGAMSDEERRRLEALGYETGIDPRQSFRAVGEYNMDIHDPDGNRFQIQAFGEEGTEILASGAGTVACGKFGEFAPGSVTRFAEGRFFLVRNADGFLALSAWCTHKNGITAWQKESWHYYCPFHGAKFDGNGVYKGDMGCQPLRLNPVSIADDGTVAVDTGRLFARDAYSPSQAVPARPGAAFDSAGLRQLAVSFKKPVGKARG